MWNIISLVLLCVLALAAAGWAHYRISQHAASTRLLTRSVLIVMGLAFGWVMAFVYTESQGLAQWLTFISAFGLVHLPAACVLQLKHWRGIPRQ